jgi:type III pantothenate kinase
VDLDTSGWRSGKSGRDLAKFLGDAPVDSAAIASVVPKATPLIRRWLRQRRIPAAYELNAGTVRGVGVDYPKPAGIGADRLANAVAVTHRFGAPALVVAFGTAVAFDVVDVRGSYVGGVIAPGLSAMTDYLHEKTALLPRIRIREPRSVVGKSTEHAMLVGAVWGYRGLIRELIVRLKEELGVKKLPVIATGGYARLIAARLPEISAVVPNLPLEGLRLSFELSRQAK